MRIDGSQLVVTCRKCGLSVVAVGWHEGQIASEKAPVGSDAPAAPSDGELVGGRLELEEGEEPPRPLSSPSLKEYTFDPEIKFDSPPVVGPEILPKIEAKAQSQGVAKTRPATSAKIPPKTRPKTPPEIQKEIFPGVAAAPRGPLKKIVVVSGVLASAFVAFYLASPSKRTEERKVEPKAVETIPTAAPAVEPSPAPAAVALLPATSSSAPPFEPRSKVSSTAQSAPPKPTSKPLAAAAVPTVMSETEALSSGLVNAEVFQERAGKIVTHILLCRNLERARDPGAALGALAVTLVVSPSGAVSNIKLDRALEGSHLGLCLRDQLGKLEFPSWTGRAIEIRRNVAPGAAEAPKAP
jgi:hypothetical protein